MTGTHSIAPKSGSALALAQKAATGLVDFVLFVVVLCFTGVAMIAVAIVAPLAVGVSAIIGRQQRTRSSWKPVKAS